jgi:hypothetical protein
MPEEMGDSLYSRMAATTMHSEAWWIRLMDDALTPEERLEWEIHLQGCVRCQQEWEMLTVVDRYLVAAPPVPELPPSFTVDTVVCIQRRQRLRKAMSAIAGTLIVVGVTVLVFSYVGAAYSALEWALGAVLSARQMLFRSLMQTFVGLVLGWRAALPYIGGITALIFLLMIPNTALVGGALLWLARRRRLELGLAGEVSNA